MPLRSTVSVFDRRLQQWEHATDALLEATPEDYRSTVELLTIAHESFRKRLALHLTPKLNQELGNHPHSYYPEKKKLAGWINADIVKLGLSLFSQTEQYPVMLAVEPSRDGKGKLHYNNRSPKGRHDGYEYRRLETFDSVDNIELIAAGLDGPQWDRWTDFVLKNPKKSRER